MRIIKFRAWHTVTKTMFYNIEMGIGAPHGNPPFADYLENEHMVVMQFTGLLDKNGKEVYEGDIVYSLSYKFDLAVKWCDGKGENLRNQVGWTLDDGRYAVEFEAHLEPDENGEEEYLNASVIGNIYQNPELLSEK